MSKKLLLSLTMLALLCGSAFAQYPPKGYIGLFSDADHCESCVTGTPLYSVEMWIWCLPSARGQICAESAVCYRTNVIQSSVTWNAALISVSLGDLANGLSVCFRQCGYDWLWIAHQTLWVTSSEKSRPRNASPLSWSCGGRYGSIADLPPLNVASFSSPPRSGADAPAPSR